MAWTDDTITTSRLRLRPFTERDKPAIVAMESSADVRRFLGGPIDDPAELEAIRAAVVGERPGVFCVADLATDEAIGTVSVDRERGEPEVSYMFRPEWWGRGLASEALAAFVVWVWRHHDDPSVIAVTQTANITSCRLLVRHGFVFERAFEEFGATQSQYRLARPEGGDRVREDGGGTTWAGRVRVATVATMSDATTQVPAPPTAPFGSVFAGVVATATYDDGAWSEPELGPLAPFSLHPATHALHYGSTCFEGLKAHRGVDGQVRLFRAAAHVARMRQSADLLCLPKPSEELLSGMMHAGVAANLDEVPAAPGSLYLRPTLIGTEPNIGAAAAPSVSALLFVLLSPVGDYFSGGIRPLKLAIETEQPRTTPQFGMVKSGANYVMALGPTLKLKAELGIDQVLFCPGGEVQETGASNFMLIDAERVVTPALTTSFLHGVTRDSILTLARDLGYQVEERTITADEVVDWARRPGAEAALSGTAAVLSPVGTIVHHGETVTVGDGGVGEHTMRLRQALTDIHTAVAPDTHGWCTTPG